MTTTVTSAPPAMRAPASTPRGGVTFGRLVVAEWIKVRTVRSSWWTLAIAVLLLGAVPILMAIGARATGSGGLENLGVGGWSSLITIGTDKQLAAIAIAVFAVLNITGEYRTGMIRSTLTAAPRRLDALAAKAVVVSVIATLATVLGLAIGLLGTLPFRSSLGLRLDLLHSDDGRILLGAVLYCAAWSLFALGVGTLVRHSAGALAIVLALPLILETILAFLPWTPTKVFAAFMPTNAGARVKMDAQALEIWNEMLPNVHMTPWQGYAVLLGWVALLLGLGGFLLRRRDA